MFLNRGCQVSLLCTGPINVMIVYDDDRREALGIWKSRLGSGATYRALIEVFFKAGRLDYADAVCSLLKDSSDTRGSQIILLGPGFDFDFVVSLHWGVQLCYICNCVIPSPIHPTPPPLKLVPTSLTP